MVAETIMAEAMTIMIMMMEVDGEGDGDELSFITSGTAIELPY